MTTPMWDDSLCVQTEGMGEIGGKSGACCFVATVDNVNLADISMTITFDGDEPPEGLEQQTITLGADSIRYNCGLCYTSALGIHNPALGFERKDRVLCIGVPKKKYTAEDLFVVGHEFAAGPSPLWACGHLEVLPLVAVCQVGSSRYQYGPPYLEPAETEEGLPTCLKINPWYDPLLGEVAMGTFNKIVYVSDYLANGLFAKEVDGKSMIVMVRPYLIPEGTKYKGLTSNVSTSKVYFDKGIRLTTNVWRNASTGAPVIYWGYQRSRQMGTGDVSGSGYVSLEYIRSAWYDPLLGHNIATPSITGLPGANTDPDTGETTIHSPFGHTAIYYPAYVEGDPQQVLYAEGNVTYLEGGNPPIPISGTARYSYYDLIARGWEDNCVQTGGGIEGTLLGYSTREKSVNQTLTVPESSIVLCRDNKGNACIAYSSYSGEKTEEGLADASWNTPMDVDLVFEEEYASRIEFCGVTLGTMRWRRHIQWHAYNGHNYVPDLGSYEKDDSCNDPYNYCCCKGDLEIWPPQVWNWSRRRDYTFTSNTRQIAIIYPDLIRGICIFLDISSDAVYTGTLVDTDTVTLPDTQATVKLKVLCNGQLHSGPSYTYWYDEYNDPTLGYTGIIGSPSATTLPYASDKFAVIFPPKDPETDDGTIWSGNTYCSLKWASEDYVNNDGAGEKVSYYLGKMIGQTTVRNTIGRSPYSFYLLENTSSHLDYYWFNHLAMPCISVGGFQENFPFGALTRNAEGTHVIMRIPRLDASGVYDYVSIRGNTVVIDNGTELKEATGFDFTNPSWSIVTR